MPVGMVGSRLDIIIMYYFLFIFLFTSPSDRATERIKFVAIFLYGRLESQLLTDELVLSE